MDSATVAIRVLVGSALAALLAGFFVVGTMSPVRGPTRKLVISRSAPSVAPVSSHKTKEPVSQRLPSKIEPALPVAQTRRTTVIDNCFTADPGITTPPSAKETALVSAALKQDWDGVRRMLDSGVSINSANEDGITPLMVAASQGDASTVGTLLRRQASVNSKDLSGRTPLCYAVQSRKLPAVQSLLPLVSDLEIASSEGGNLFTIAFENGDQNIFQSLLERVPDTTLEWSRGTRGALVAALHADNREQVQLLMNKHREPPTSEGGVVPLIAYTIAKDDATAFQTLLTCGSDPNTIIPKTAEKEFLSLLKSKSLRSYVQDEGVNILMLAAGLGKPDYVRTLIEAGADRNRTTARGTMRPLYFAAWTGDWRCMQLLLGSGPKPDQLRLEISLARQHMAVIKDGVTVLTTRCSTGREGFTTPTGEYVITDKDRDHRSTIYKVPMPYFMRLSCRDFGMHGGIVPTYAASHGCIRLPSEVARRLFSEIPVGTVVMIN